MEVYLDLEFNRTNEHPLNLVCATLSTPDNNYIEDFWLHNSPEECSRLKEKILEFKNFTFVAWQAAAEARCFYSLGLTPTDFNWIDLFIEYRNLSNKNDHYNYGKQLKDGKVIFTSKPKPKWQRTEEDDQTGFKPTHSLAEATYKLLGEKRDTAHKEKMRNLIISDPDKFGAVDKAAIMEYCREDVVHLPDLYDKIEEGFIEFTGDELNIDQALYRGKYAALTGIREARGYPINMEQAKNFGDAVPIILYDCQVDINSQFPDILPFKWNKTHGRMSWNQKVTKEWLKENVDTEMWKKTDKGDLSLSLDAWEKKFDFKHSYPRGNFGAQMVRYLKMKQSFNGFTVNPDKKKKTFWDAVGSDGRVRPYMNIFGSQSSRSQPPATSYLLLKPAWTRSLLQPPPGKCITSIDYGSEEYLITALYYRDVNMIKSYLSGDVYLAFGKLSGAIPKHATKKSHKEQRDIFKSVCLGISFMMSKYGLAIKLTNESGKTYTEDDAEQLIADFYSSYEQFAEGQSQWLEDYKEGTIYESPSGWFMFGDNENFRSVANVPIQTLGADIMREADLRCWGDGQIYACCTLHDALYIEHDYGDWEVIDRAMNHMRDAFVHFFPGQEKYASKIRLDPFTWGPDISQDKITTPAGVEVGCSKIYIDDRAVDEYERYKKYFEPLRENEL